MDYELFKSVINESSQYGSRSFSLHLFGEPLLWPYICDGIRYIKQQNKRHTVLLTTNGTHLNKFADELVGVGVDQIIWSWRKNNFNTRTREILRRKGKIRILVEETPKEEFEYWSKYPNVEIKHLHNYGGHIDISKWGLGNKEDKIKRYPCYHLWLAPAVRWNGEFVFCCNVPHHTIYSSLGNVKEKSISEMWKDSKLAKVREDHMKGEYLDACKSCDSWTAYPSIF